MANKLKKRSDYGPNGQDQGSTYEPFPFIEGSPCCKHKHEKNQAISAFEFIAKEENYWNASRHDVVVDHAVCEVNYQAGKGYFCELKKP